MDVIETHIRDMLNMRQPPRHLASDGAREDAIRQIVSAVREKCPDGLTPEELRAWIGRVQEKAFVLQPGVIWPTVTVWARAVGGAIHEHEKASGQGGGDEIQAADISSFRFSFRVFVDRIRSGDPVNEDHLFSVRYADRALRDNLISLDDLRQRQLGAFRARQKIYGDDAAFSWLDQKAPQLSLELRRKRRVAGEMRAPHAD